MLTVEKIKSTLSTPIDPFLEKSEKYRFASILVIIYGKKPIVVMTEKPKDMKFHAGEISFPGGKPEPGDSDLLETALRETSEEIGLTITREQVIGQLDPVITLNSGFIILPFISIVDEIPKLSANCEVEKILHIPLESFLETMETDPDPAHNIIQEMYVFKYNNQIIWGASARILKQIHSSLKS